MNWWLISGVWLLCSALTYFQFRRVIRRERFNPELLAYSPKMALALQMILNTQLGHALIILGSLVPLFWLFMLVDLVDEAIMRKRNA